MSGYKMIILLNDTVLQSHSILSYNFTTKSVLFTNSI
jgi:hypothetical protein